MFKIVILWEIQRMDCKIMKTMSIVINPRRNHKAWGIGIEHWDGSKGTD